jgi:TRAP-type C4-dicarboxylate transport system substrate-binding protein
MSESGGDFAIEVFPQSRLGPDPKMFADLRDGALELYLAGAWHLLESYAGEIGE